ncbi:MAG: DNA replication/repair protein RecF [Bacteroidales bacterium]|nr:DNA replication/repair protein RecF [Bacteroidales bacterium]
MRVKKLNIVNFKNHSQREFSFEKKINCFVGKNGVGKTNVLDALYYLSFSKSFINSVDNQNIKNGEDFFSLRGVYEVNEMEENILLSFDKNKGKTLKRNDKEYDKIASHIGLLPLIIVSPQDIKLLFDGSAERRKFLDSALSQFDGGHLIALQNYNRALLQRNKILKTSPDAILLEMWDRHLISNGETLYENRKKFIADFMPEFEKYYLKISSGSLEIPSLRYSSPLENERMEDILKSNFQRDSILQYTTSGAHKDDLVFSIGDLPLKNCGSQGQQKTFLTALKLAQYAFLYNKSGKKPVLLLDDIFDKLDPQRVSSIAELILSDGIFGQIFITHTNPDDLKQILEKFTDDFEMFEIL